LTKKKGEQVFPFFYFYTIMANFTAEDIDVTITFGADGKTIQWHDNVDYSAYNVPQTTIKGLGTANDPDGDVFVSKLSTGDPLINLGAGNDDSLAFSLPVDDDGEIVLGAYPILYRVYVPYAATGVAITSFTNSGATNTILLNGVDLGWMEAGDTFTVSGATPAENNGVRTVVSVSVVGGNTTITVSETVVTNATAGAVIAYTIAKNYDYTDTFTWSGLDAVTPDLVMEANCDAGTMGSLTATDSTVYTVNDIAHTVTNHVINVYPPHIVPAPSSDPYTTTAYAFTINELITNAQYVGEILADLTYTQTDGLVVVYSLTGLPANSDGQYPNQFSIDVDCAGTLCGLMDCINAFWNDFKGCTTPSSTQVIKASRIEYAVMGYNESRSCGNTSEMASYLADLEEILGGDCSCASDSNVPRWVNNSSESLTTIITEMQAQITALEAAQTYVEPIAHIPGRMITAGQWLLSPFVNMTIDERFLEDSTGYVKITTNGVSTSGTGTLTIADSTLAINAVIPLDSCELFTLVFTIGYDIVTGGLVWRYVLVIYNTESGGMFQIFTDQNTFTFAANTNMTLTISTNEEANVGLIQTEVIGYKTPASIS
jgi:hypothetical protein